jgi:ankyrin repeat protein
MNINEQYILNKIEKDEINIPIGNTINEYKPPLFYCIEQNNLELVKLCIENGAYVNYQCYNLITQATPLTYAIYMRCLDTTINDYIDYDENFEIIKYLIEKGADLEDIIFLEGIIVSQEILFEDNLLYNSYFYKYDYSPLYIAAMSNDLELIKLLVENGCDVNKKMESGYTAIDWSIKNRRMDIIQYFLNNKAELNIYNEEYENKILFDCKFSIELIEYLLEKGYKIKKSLYNFLYKKFNRISIKTNDKNIMEYMNVIICLFKYHIIFNTKKIINKKNKKAYDFINKKIIKYLNTIPKIYFQQLIEKTWHPNRFMKWCLSIDEIKEFD